MAIDKVNVTKSVKDFNNDYLKQRLNFDLAVQRKDNVWNLQQKSLFIHSLLYGYPIPPFFCVEKDGKMYNFLDGKQRLNSIFQYLADQYSLDEDTPDVDGIEIAGLKYSELSEEFQDTIRTRPLTAYIMKDIDDSEIDELFYRLNNGSELKMIEKIRSIAGSVIMEFIDEIASHKFFTDNIAISESARNRYGDIEIVFQVLSILTNGYNNDISGKNLLSFAKELHDKGIPESMQQLIRDLTDYIYKAVPVKDKFLKKVHIPIIFNTAVLAYQKIDPEIYGGFLQNYFKNPSKAYLDAAHSKSASKESIKIRITELKEAFDKNIYSASKYEPPKPKQPGGRRGRPKKNGEVTVTKIKPESVVENEPK